MATATPIYAAYGSNSHPDQMRQRCPRSPLVGTGWVSGWRLTFGGQDLGWEGALATVVPATGFRVFVALYDIHPDDVAALDSWEQADTGLYRKIRTRVSTLEGEILAWLYSLTAYEGGLPSARYLGVLADAAEAGGAPDDYVLELRQRPCRGLGED